MNEKVAKDNFVLSLFDWRIKKLLALQYFKILYLIILVLTTIYVAAFEFYIARFLDVSILLKFIYGMLTILGGLLFILICRITYEFYFAFFYIEEHLREIRRKS